MVPYSVGHSWKAGIIIFDTLQTPCCELHPGVPPNAYNTDRGSLIHELCALRPRDRERLMITSLGRANDGVCPTERAPSRSRRRGVVMLKDRYDLALTTASAAAPDGYVPAYGLAL